MQIVISLPWKDALVEAMLYPASKIFITEKRTVFNLLGNFNLYIPKVNITRYGLKSWRYAAANHWNTLPRDIPSMADSKDFLKKI